VTWSICLYGRESANERAKSGIYCSYREGRERKRPAGEKRRRTGCYDQEGKSLCRTPRRLRAAGPRSSELVSRKSVGTSPERTLIAAPASEGGGIKRPQNISTKKNSVKDRGIVRAGWAMRNDIPGAGKKNKDIRDPKEDLRPGSRGMSDLYRISEHKRIIRIGT